jgi:hypothetical protein
MGQVVGVLVLVAVFQPLWQDLYQRLRHAFARHPRQTPSSPYRAYAESPHEVDASSDVASDVSNDVSSDVSSVSSVSSDAPHIGPRRACPGCGTTNEWRCVGCGCSGPLKKDSLSNLHRCENARGSVDWARKSFVENLPVRIEAQPAGLPLLRQRCLHCQGTWLCTQIGSES